MADGYDFRVPAGGAACCSATGCLHCCCGGNCGHGSLPTPFPACFRLPLLLEVIRLGYPEVRQWLRASD